MTQPFSLTDRQREGNALLGSAARHIMLFGGSRSGKTFLVCRAIATRALKAPGSRHCVLRFRYNAVKSSIIMDTWPKMLALCYPGIEARINVEGFTRLPNGSEVWFGGLDDKERTEKILGQEFATIFLNECSQIPWASREMAVTRLAQKAMVKVEGMADAPLALKMYYDENPPDKNHWSYRLFVLHVDPETRKPLPNPQDYAALQINPGDNRDNLPAEYFTTLEGLSARMRLRFLRGEFRDANPSALFPDEILERWRVSDSTDLPDMVRIVVAVDPSGSDDTDNADADEIGIVVAGLGTDGNGYVLEDLTMKGGPAKWAAAVGAAYTRHDADLIVAEVNYGGAMVKSVIKTALPKANYKAVTASRGKAVRAEPISALCESGKVRLVGYLPELEDELSGFTTSGYVGDRSPNRGDAFVWAFAELFPGMVKPREVDGEIAARFQPSRAAFG